MVAAEVEPAELPPLPADASRAMRKVAEFFALVVAVRRHAGMPGLVPFANDWVAEHTGLPGVTVSRALLDLRKAGTLVWDGQTLKHPKTRLYAVGALEARAVPVESATLQPDDVGVDEHGVVPADVAPAAAVDDGVVAAGDGAEEGELAELDGRLAHGPDDTPSAGAQCAILGWDDP
jgi:hypothetical protein